MEQRPEPPHSSGTAGRPGENAAGSVSSGLSARVRGRRGSSCVDYLLQAVYTGWSESGAEVNNLARPLIRGDEPSPPAAWHLAALHTSRSAPGEVVGSRSAARTLRDSCG